MSTRLLPRGAGDTSAHLTPVADHVEAAQASVRTGSSEMDSLRVFGTVKFSTEAGLVRHEPDHWVMDIKGTITGDIEKDGQEIIASNEVVGELEAFYVMTTQAINDGISLEDACDAHSDSLLAAYSAVFSKGYEPKKALQIEPSWEGFLYIYDVSVKDEYRNTTVVAQAVEALIRCFCPGGIITASKEEISLTVEEWKQLGFMNIARTRYVFRDNCSKNPYGLNVPEDG